MREGIVGTITGVLLIVAVFLMVDKPGLPRRLVALHVRTLGAGEPLLLVHGGVGPEITWAAQEPLADRWKLLIPTAAAFRRARRPSGRTGWRMPRTSRSC